MAHYLETASRGACYNWSMQEHKSPKRPPTSGTRKSNGAGLGGPAKGAGLWGRANGMGWGGESRAIGLAQNRRMTTDERATLRHEMIEIYLSIVRDLEQPAMVRMQLHATCLRDRQSFPRPALSSPDVSWTPNARA